jgi:Rne/Rng family ribonuclease
MKREILINAGARETRVAILEDEKLVELLVDRPDTRRMVGDVYLGKVEAVLPGIQAAFVDIGTEKSAFLMPPTSCAKALKKPKMRMRRRIRPSPRTGRLVAMALSTRKAEGNRAARVKRLQFRTP